MEGYKQELAGGQEWTGGSGEEEEGVETFECIFLLSRCLLDGALNAELLLELHLMFPVISSLALCAACSPSCSGVVLPSKSPGK